MIKETVMREELLVTEGSHDGHREIGAERDAHQGYRLGQSQVVRPVRAYWLLGFADLYVQVRTRETARASCTTFAMGRR